MVAVASVLLAQNQPEDKEPFFFFFNAYELFSVCLVLKEAKGGCWDVGSPGLELPVVLSSHVGAGNQTTALNR